MRSLAMKEQAPSESKPGGGKRKRKSVWEKRWDGAIKKSSRPALKPAIWSKTPDDIQLRLLERLPVTSLCRFRSVSKRWHSAIAATTPTTTGSEFVSICCGMIRVRIGSSWKKFGYTASGMSRPSHRGSSSGGLLLGIDNENAMDCRFHVDNPFVPNCSRVVELLPPVDDEPHIIWLAFTGIQALPVRSGDNKVSFLIVCFTCGRRALLHVFDSRRWSWVLTSAEIPGIGSYLGDSGFEEAVWSRNRSSACLLRDDRFYFLTISRSNTKSLKSVSIWDPGHSTRTLATWTDLPLNLHHHGPDLLGVRGQLTLILCQGKMMLVDTIDAPPPCGSVGFVYLDEETRTWRELLSFPLETLPERVKKAHAKKNHRICVSVAGSSESSKVTLDFPDSDWGCIFDVSDSTWCTAFTAHGSSFCHFHPSFRTF